MWESDQPKAIWMMVCSVATIDRRLSSIGYYHKQARHSLSTKDPEVERTMRGIRRAKGIAPNGKKPHPHAAPASDGRCTA
jgi:hypothetical protein